MLKSSLIVAFIVAGIYASNPAVGVLSVIASVVLYFVARKSKQVLVYYSPVKNLDADSET